MTIVANNDDLWKSMANDKLTAEEVAKTSAFGENRSRKSPIYKSAFFGGSAHSSFSSVTATALASGSTPSSVFGSSSAPNQLASSSTAATTFTTAAADDGGDDEGGDDDENDANDREGSPTNANHASMKIISLPENVKLVTGEEDDECMLQMRAKMFRLNAHATAFTDAESKGNTAAEKSGEEAAAAVQATGSGAVDVANVLAAVGKASEASKAGKSGSSVGSREAEWVEVGIGPLKILSRKVGAQSSGRLVMRREDKQGGLGTLALLLLFS